MKFPRVVCTTVKAELPCACLVITTLLLMVVATQPKKINPTSNPGSTKSLLVAVADTTPNAIALVMRKHWPCTKRCTFHRE